MGVRERIMICRVIEKMEKQESYGKRLGLKNESTFHGRAVRSIRTQKKGNG